MKYEIISIQQTSVTEQISLFKVKLLYQIKLNSRLKVRILSIEDIKCTDSSPNNRQELNSSCVHNQEMRKVNDCLPRL